MTTRGQKASKKKQVVLPHETIWFLERLLKDLLISQQAAVCQTAIVLEELKRLEGRIA